MYNPTPQQAEIDRKKAYESGIPHGASLTSIVRSTRCS